MLFFAVVDCTGHGVPGGFLSMMGFALLNEIIHIEKVYDPAKILYRLDTEIRQSLKQKKVYTYLRGIWKFINFSCLYHSIPLYTWPYIMYFT